MKKKRKIVGSVRQGIDRKGHVFYSDSSGIRISKKQFIKKYIDENEPPEKLLSGEAQTLYKKEIQKPFIVRLENGRFAPKIIQEYAREKAEENGTTVRDLITKNPELLKILHDASYDFSVSAKAEYHGGQVRFDKRHIFDKISEHNGPIFIEKTHHTKTSALSFFQKQVLKDVHEIREDNDGANPYFVSYEGKYNARTNTLYLPGTYSDYQIDTKELHLKKAIKDENKKNAKKQQRKPNPGNRNTKRTKK